MVCDVLSAIVSFFVRGTLTSCWLPLLEIAQAATVSSVPVYSLVADPGDNLTGAPHSNLGVVGVVGLVSMEVGLMR